MLKYIRILSKRNLNLIIMYKTQMSGIRKAELVLMISFQMNSSIIRVIKKKSN